MTRMIIAVLCVLALGGMSTSSGEWNLQIHLNGTIEQFAVADIDSMTFVYSPSLILVPAGAFIMGDGISYGGNDQHEVTLTRDFYLGQFEVTNEEYLEALRWAYARGLVTATPSSVDDNLDGSSAQLLVLSDPECEIAFDGESFHLRDVGHGINPTNPIQQVTWFGAARYCDWLSLQAGAGRAYQHTGDWACNNGDPYGAAGYRLPTDAEWEYAAQWDDERAYPWGQQDPDCGLANYEYCVGWTMPVGSYPNAPTTLQLFDMGGNAFEWCNDWWELSLGGDPATDPVGPASGDVRVERGGCWSGNSEYMRCAERHDHPPTDGACLGFRVARTAGD